MKTILFSFLLSCLFSLNSGLLFDGFDLEKKGSFYANGTIDFALISPTFFHFPQLPSEVSLDIENKKIWFNYSDYGWRLVTSNGTYLQLANNDFPPGQCYFVESWNYTSQVFWMNLNRQQDRNGDVRDYSGLTRDVTSCQNFIGGYVKTKKNKLRKFSVCGLYIIASIPQNICGNINLPYWKKNFVLDAPYWNIPENCIPHNTSLCARQFPNGCAQVMDFNPIEDKYPC